MASFYSSEDPTVGASGTLEASSDLDASNDENTSFNSINLLSPVGNNHNNNNNINNSSMSGTSPCSGAQMQISEGSYSHMIKSSSPMVGRNLSLSAFKLSRVANTNIIFSDRSSDNSPLCTFMSPDGSVNSDVVAICHPTSSPSSSNVQRGPREGNLGSAGSGQAKKRKSFSDDSSQGDSDSYVDSDLKSENQNSQDRFGQCINAGYNDVLGTLASSDEHVHDNFRPRTDEGVTNVNSDENDASVDILSDEERISRESAESERLAWELMRQDGIDMYQMQVDFMRNNSTEMSEDDIRAIEAAVRENAQYDFTVINHHLAAPSAQGGEEDNAYDEEEGEGNEEVDGGGGEDNQGMDYEHLLALGNQMGDVKTERWQRTAKRFIERLPVATIADIRRQRGDVEPRCVICMDDWTEDGQCEEDVCVKLLQCRHYFHGACAEGWLKDHYQCPICKCKVTGTP